MEFRQLKYFAAVAEVGNIGLAAEKLNISQPPVSRQIQALEYELGTQLLVRTSRGVELTEAGRVFHKEARKILLQADLAKERSKDAGQGNIGTLDVAFFGSPVYHAVPMALRAFRRGHPHTTVRLTRMGKAQQIEALQDGQVHVGFGRYFPVVRGIAIELVAEEEIYAAVPRDLPLAQRGEVQMSDISAIPMVLFPSHDRPSFADVVIGAFREKGLDVAIDCFADDATSAMAMVASGTRCCLVPASVAALQFPTLKFMRVVDSPIRAPINCIYMKERQSPILASFLKSLRATPLTPL